jgi:quinol monooxygenase YgiN
MAVTVTLTFSVKPERAEEFKSLLKELLPDTRAYDGCRSVDVYQDQDNPGLIYLVENRESKAHQQKYQAWRDETGIAETVGPFLAGEPKFNYFDKQDI